MNLVVSLILWRTLTLVALWAGTMILPINHAFTIFRDSHYPDFGFTLPYWLTAWGNFDAFYYMGIAKRGYFTTELPFFPLYPFTIALLTQLMKGLPFLVSGLIISHAAFIAGLAVCVKLLVRDGKRVLTPWFLLAILSFPTSYSFGAVYNDSLFFLHAALTLYWSRSGKWWHAGIAGGLATLTRLNGLALFPFLIAEYLTTRMSDSASWQWRTIGKQLILLPRRLLTDTCLHAILLVPAAFGGYLFYIQHVFGSWTKLFTAMNTWGQDRMIIPLQVVWRYGKILAFTPLTQLIWWVAFLELAAVLFYAFFILWSWKKIRLSYWIFFAVSILIPSLTGTFQGMPRYGLHLYPMFMVLAMYLSRQSILGKTLYVIGSLALLFFCIVLFTRGYFIA